MQTTAGTEKKPHVRQDDDNTQKHTHIAVYVR